MKGKQLAILLATVVVLGGVWYLLSGSSWSQGGQGAGAKVVNFPLNDITRVLIKASDGEVNLVKKSDVWTVQERADYPAKFEEVSDLLRKLYELKTVQTIKVGPSQMGRLELVEPGKGSKAGTLVQLSLADGKPAASLLLGKPYLRKSEGHNMGMAGMDFGGMPAGRYVKPTDGSTVSLVSDPLNSVVAKPENWLTKDFVAVDGAKSVAVAGPTKAEHWTTVRDSAASEWKLADAKGDEKLDPAKTTGLNSLLSSANPIDVLAPGTNPEAPVSVATVETFDGFRYELSIGKDQGANVPVSVKVEAKLAKERPPGKDEKPEDKKRLDDEFAAKQKQSEDKLAKEKKLEGRTYLLSKSSVDALLKNRSDLLAAQPATPAPSPTPVPVSASAEPAVSGTPSISPVPPPAPPPAPTPSPATPTLTPEAPAPLPTPVATPVVTPSPVANPVPSAIPVVTPLPSETPVPSVPVTVTTPPMTATPSPIETVSPSVVAPPPSTPEVTPPTSGTPLATPPSTSPPAPTPP